MKDYHLAKLPEYSNFWCLLYFLGVVLITMFVVMFRGIFLGYSSSHVYSYGLIFLIIYCFLATWQHISSSSKNSNDLMLMFFYFVFAVVFVLCLLNLPPSILDFDLMTMISTLRSNFSSFFSSLFSLSSSNSSNPSINLFSHLHIPSSVFGFIFALLLGFLPPLLVESAFRFAQLELRKSFTISGFLSSHLLCLVCFFSIPGILHIFEGKMICGIL